ncbi:DUF4175 domain-containing protein [Celeribacter indicus]|uniref:ATPase n=1 Tax=Celeribacter indicus TaxID=1208324 RepID=A0A0B5E6B4_9RHOB|nr:DUF4175 domain-containing protein [Celeribacter indicus]AJE48965.1 hypothetical protein P73_4250 [Celeribacter indicus]SDW42482.1 TIGR02302 family protein [Celeribacter indicus]
MAFDRKLDQDLTRSLARRVRTALRATWAGLLFERAGQALWPFFSLLCFFTGLALLGVHDLFPTSLRMGLLIGAGVVLLVAFALGLRRFRLPGKGLALARVDARLPGRPLQALSDAPLAGAGDPASESLWAAHRRRMIDRLVAVRAVAPMLRLAPRDPFALRLVALTTLGMGLVFGSFDRARTAGDLGTGGPEIAMGPIWEGWVRPPSYSGKPTLYLGDLGEGFEVPKGADVTVRFYGEDGVLTLRETVSGETPSEARDFPIRQEGEIEIDGPTGRLWNVALQPDRPPEAELVDAMTRAPSGEMRQNFRLSDDFGVARAVLTITRDPEAVEARYGYQLPPEDRPAVEVPVALPQTGNRGEIEGMIAENLAEHPFAGLPVQISLTAWDEAGQASEEALGEGILPTRRFFDPLAAAIVDVRRELLWNRENATRAAQVLRAATVDPNEVFDNMNDFFRLRGTVDQIETREGALTDEQLDQIAQELWEIAVELEDGELKEALARLHRAQERLSEAMRDGATPEEIARLMEELREATRDYMQQLAEQQGEQEDGTDQPDQGEQGQEITQDQLQELMDRIQELMEQGRMAEAQQLLDMLAEMLENMRVTQGQGQGQGNQQMQGLQDMLRDQQELNDDTFSDLQEQFGQQQGGQQGQDQGQQQGQQQGQDGQGGEPGGRQQGQGGGPDEGTLAERQRALRNELNRQRQQMPGGGTGGDENTLGGALDRADRAMDEAEDRLAEGDLSGALDNQAEAMEALREGMRQLGEQQAENQQDQQDGQPGQDGGNNGADPARRDPLGRSAGDTGRFGSDEELYEGEDVYRRAEELLDEIRRRSAEQERSAEERDYLNRLLDRF